MDFKKRFIGRTEKLAKNGSLETKVEYETNL